MSASRLREAAWLLLAVFFLGGGLTAIVKALGAAAAVDGDHRLELAATGGELRDAYDQLARANARVRRLEAEQARVVPGSARQVPGNPEVPGTSPAEPGTEPGT